LTKEEEEELRRKQATLFQNDQSMYMQPSQQNNPMNTPTFPSANLGVPSQVYQPNDPEFYNGSITQVLKNPSINPGMQQPVVQQASDIQNPESGSPNASGEEIDEPGDTNPQASEPPMPTLQDNRGKSNYFSLEVVFNINLGVSVTDVHPSPTAPQPIQANEAEIAMNQQIAGQHNLNQYQKEKKEMEEEEEDFE
jgi:hypothetical protein